MKWERQGLGGREEEMQETRSSSIARLAGGWWLNRVQLGGKRNKGETGGPIIASSLPREALITPSVMESRICRSTVNGSYTEVLNHRIF